MNDAAILELEIQDISRGGKGVARSAEGVVIFVPYTMTGDRVRVRITSRAKNYADAELIELVSPGPGRAEPPCPAFGSCGGCEWQHLPYALQWQTKTKGLRHALARVQGNPQQIPLEEMPAERAWNYRNRIQLRGQGSMLGFYARGTKKIIPIQECFIARTELNAVLPEIRKKGREQSREYKVEIEVHPGGKVTEAWNARHGALGFRQIFDEQNEKLQSWIGGALKDTRILLDLFGGNGNLSRPLAEKCEKIYCVDTFAPEKSPPTHSPQNIFFHAHAVHDWFNHAVPENFQASAAILDPPREGLDIYYMPILNGLDKAGVREVVLVGCDIDSWARDIARFSRHGWTLQRIAALDLFPQTHHLEALAYFTKSP